MAPLDVSEAQLWRRCSFAALAVLILSVAGETFLNPAEAPRQAKKRTCTWSSTYTPASGAFRMLNQLFLDAAR
jgi:hypothetical protein